MSYLTKTRVTPRPLPDGWRQRSAFTGRVYDYSWESSYGLQVVPSQTTWTWSNQDSVEHRMEVDARIFRNGLTSYDPVYDRGHEFWTTKTSRWFSNWDHFMDLGSGDWFRGPLVPKTNIHEPSVIVSVDGVPREHKDPYPPLPVDGDVLSKGAEAIKATAPGAPLATLGTTLVETLRDVPQIIGHKLLTDKDGYFSTHRDGGLNIETKYQDVGGEYLNYQFGLAPTVKDLVRAVNNLLNASQRIRQFERDNGRYVRRRFTFPSEVTSTETRLNQGFDGPLLGANKGFFNGGEQREWLSKVDRTDRKVWFSGCYSYYFPTPKGLTGKLEEFERRANHLLGTRLTPDALWQLSPWSWLIDWYGTIGDTISNANRMQDDGLVIRWAYLMVHTKREYQWSTLPGLTTYAGELLPTAMATYSRETKRRYRASPFGFGLATGDLNPQQWAILTALGLSSAPSLRQK